MSVLIGQKLVKSAKIENLKCHILGDFQTLCATGIYRKPRLSFSFRAAEKHHKKEWREKHANDIKSAHNIRENTLLLLLFCHSTTIKKRKLHFFPSLHYYISSNLTCYFANQCCILLLRWLARERDLKNRGYCRECTKKIVKYKKCIKLGLKNTNVEYTEKFHKLLPFNARIEIRSIRTIEKFILYRSFLSM